MSIDDILNAFSAGLNSSSMTLSIISLIAYAILVLILMSVFAYLLGWLERKIIARIQHRHGPTYLGPFGFLQNFADFFKLLTKEKTLPEEADALLFTLSPLILFAVTILIILLLPIFPSLQATDLGFGILIIGILISFMPILISIAGFSSNNKFSNIGAQRSVLMLMSYELPMIMVIASVALLARSFNLQQIINAQSSYYFALLMPIGLFVFFVAMLAEMERPPFDVREADSELVAGWLTDVSAPYFAIMLLLDYSRLFTGSLIIALLFFGGWSGPILPSVLWLVIKAMLISIFIIFIRATTLRMRIDRILRSGWLLLLPLSLINLIIAYIVLV